MFHLSYWDLYISGGLKNTAREKRGKGIRRKVMWSTLIPNNWKDFLHDDELFSLISHQVISIETEEKNYICDRWKKCVRLTCRF